MNVFKILPVLAALGLGAAPVMAAEPSLVTVITAPEAQVQMMSLVLTLQAAKQGASAHILLCGPGGDLALDEAPASATAPQKPMGASPRDLMTKAMQAGVKIDVCAIYLPNKDLPVEALIEGVGVAKPDAMSAELMAADRVLSF